MVSPNVSVNNIESPGLSRDNTAKRQGDGSFDAELETARKKISLIAPWAEVQKIFNIIPLEFNFDFNAGEIEDNVPKKYSEPDKVKAESAKTEKEIKTQVQENTKTISYFKITKETFKENLPSPLPFYPIPAPGLANGTSFKPITKEDLQMLIDEIVEKIEILKINRRTELNMSLSYENLGDLTLLLSLKNGFVSVQIAAAQAETKKSLEENLSELESALKNAKINIADIKILEVKNDNHSNRPG